MVSDEFEIITGAIFKYGIVSNTVFFLGVLKIIRTREALCILFIAIYNTSR